MLSIAVVHDLLDLDWHGHAVGVLEPCQGGSGIVDDRPPSVKSPRAPEEIVGRFDSFVHENPRNNCALADEDRHLRERDRPGDPGRSVEALISEEVVPCPCRKIDGPRYFAGSFVEDRRDQQIRSEQVLIVESPLRWSRPDTRAQAAG